MATTRLGAMDNKKSMSVSTRASDATTLSESSAGLLRELVAHLRQNRTQLREEWARRITRAELLTAMTEEEIFAAAGRSVASVGCPCHRGCLVARDRADAGVHRRRPQRNGHGR